MMADATVIDVNNAQVAAMFTFVASNLRYSLLYYFVDLIPLFFSCSAAQIKETVKNNHFNLTQNRNNLSLTL